LEKAILLAVQVRRSLAAQLQLTVLAPAAADAAASASAEAGEFDQEMEVRPRSPLTAFLPSLEEAEDECAQLLEEASVLERNFLPDPPAEEDEDEQAVGTAPSKTEVEQPCSRARQAVRALPDSQEMNHRSLRVLPKETMQVVDQVLPFAQGNLRAAPPGARLLPSEPLATSPSFAGKGRQPLRGHILAYSMPAPRSKSKERARMKALAKRAASTSALIIGEKVYADPFTEWRESVAVRNKDKMSFVQLNCETWGGMTKLLHEFKYQNKTFKTVDMKFLEDLGEARLFENQAYFSSHGLKASEVGRQREEAWKAKHQPPSQKERKRLVVEKELFSSLGLKLPVDKKGNGEPSVKDLRRLLSESLEQSSVMKEQRRREATERELASEEGRLEAEVERIRMQKEQFGGLKRGGAGQSMFSFG